MVILGGNLTGFGKRPEATPAHHVDLPTGMSRKTSGSLNSPSNLSPVNIGKPLYRPGRIFGCMRYTVEKEKRALEGPKGMEG